MLAQAIETGAALTEDTRFLQQQLEAIVKVLIKPSHIAYCGPRDNSCESLISLSLQQDC